ncbi:MAG: hypothetical protein AAGF11_40710 [Myxococcota bacterium]
MTSARQICAAFGRVSREPYGVKFHKVDFHFHTPGSADARGKNRYGFNPYKDVKYPSNDHSWERVERVRSLQAQVLEQARALARSMVDRFIEQRLAMVAITDHNGIATIWADPDDPRGKSMDLAAPTWYELVSEEAERRNHERGKVVLTILPGTEISTTGVHILAIFPPSSPKRKIHFLICDLLTEVGLAVDDFGKNPKVGHASVRHTLELIQAKGGIPIIAHIDGSDQSLLKLHDIKSGAMKNVLSHSYLRAIEMVDPARLSCSHRGLRGQSLGDWIASVRRKAGLGPIAFFQGSDAHDLRTIGKRFTYLKMSAPSFSGLRNAILSPSSRVRVAELHTPPRDGLYVYGVEVRNDVLGTRRLRFNRHLNAVVGRRDCGKSLLLSLMNKAVDDRSELRGSVKLFMERHEQGRSGLYCYTNARGKIRLHALRADDGGSWSAESIPDDHPEYTTLRPKFYDAERMEQIIGSSQTLEQYLVRRLGKPSKKKVKQLAESFEIPTFLTPEPCPLLSLGTTKHGRYTLGLNTNWRRGRPKFTSFDYLSKSRRRLVVLSLVMLSSRPGPLIVDEPDRHFDNEDIAEFLVPLVKHMKNFRQIIFATNSSNLTINSDPENYVVLEADRGKVKKMQAGFALDDEKQRDALITIMEGTLKSFVKRGLQYGTSSEQ